MNIQQKPPSRAPDKYLDKAADAETTVMFYLFADKARTK
jgi:hypothetical protein